MSVAISDLRFAISDLPRTVGIAPESARVLGVGDGVTTTFFLPLDRFTIYVPGSATLFGTIGGVTTGIPSTAYTIPSAGQDASTTSPANMVVFGTAPAAGTTIAGQFQVVAFSDYDLGNVLARNLAQFGVSSDSDANTLRGCQIDIINILLLTPDRMAALTEAEYKRDPAAVIGAYKSQLATLQQLIATPPRPDTSTPVLTLAGPRLRNYQPGR